MKYNNEVKILDTPIRDPGNAPPKAVICPICGKGVYKYERRIQLVNGKQYYTHKNCRGL